MGKGCKKVHHHPARLVSEEASKAKVRKGGWAALATVGSTRTEGQQSIGRSTLKVSWLRPQLETRQEDQSNKENKGETHA